MRSEDKSGLSSGFLGRGGTCGFSHRELFGLLPLAAHWGGVGGVALPGLTRLRLSIENPGAGPGASSHMLGGSLGPGGGADGQADCVAET